MQPCSTNTPLHLYTKCVAAVITTALLVFIPTARADDDDPNPSTTAPQQVPTVKHFSSKTTVLVGHSRIIAFGVENPPATIIDLDTTVSDSSLLEITRSAQILPDESIGYVRVFGRKAGFVTLSVGSATLDVMVRDARLPIRAPLITGPAQGAVVWGTISIGVERREYPLDQTGQLQLRVGDDLRLNPIEDHGGQSTAVRSARFELDTTSISRGPTTLRPVVILKDETIIDGQAITIDVRHFNTEEIIGGEAETNYDVERPERFKNNRRTIGRHKDASGGKFFSNASALPAVCFPLSVEKAGWYQMAVVGAGTLAQGALPSIGIIIDEAGAPITNGRVLSREWHRFSVGIPFRLEPGDHVITPFFTNDFYVPNAVDRNLMLDRLEFARVRDEAESLDSANTAGGMMAPMDVGSLVTDDGDLDDPFGLSPARLRVGWVRVLEGRVLSGVIQIEGRCWWAGAERQLPAPTVTLLINGKAICSQRSGAPRFWVDPAHFVAGTNTLQLVAQLEDGTVARTPTQHMKRPAAAIEGQATTPRKHERFSIHDERWESPITMVNQHYPKERKAAIFYSDGSAILNLPDNLEGSYKLFVEAFGEHFQGAPMLSCVLRVGDSTMPIGEDKNVPQTWADLLIGEVDLPPGPKQLVLSYINDKHIEDQGDRNLLFQATILARNPLTDDRTAPVAEIIYPANGAQLYMQDALVGWAADNASVASAELLIDGVPTGLNASITLQPGDGLIPLPLRSLEPGEHTLTLRVSDVSGNIGESEPRTINILNEAPTKPGPYERAIHLLNRLGYGPDPLELAALLTMGESQWLQDRLESTIDTNGDMAATGMATPYFVNRNNYEVPRRVVSHLLTTPNPIQARFVQWVENHFSTWIGKVQGARQWRQHIAFARLGATYFDQLLFASAESPAMITYLDQERSFKKRLNENYAREVMELHTVGVHGGYNQQDVTNLAQVLTGWTASVEGDGRSAGPMANTFTFRFDPRLNDGTATTVLGLQLDSPDASGRYDRARMALEMLAAHPSTAHFIVSKLAEHYVAIPVPSDLIEAMTNVFLETGGDLNAVMISMVEHDAFWRNLQPSRIAHALDYALRMFRACALYQPWLLSDFLQRSGFGMYDRATPDGYPEDDASHTDSNAMTQRWRLANDARWQLAALVPPGWRYGQGGADDEQWTQTVIDIIAIRLTGRVLSPESNEAALDILNKTEGSHSDRVVAIAPFIALLPEVNLR